MMDVYDDFIKAKAEIEKLKSLLLRVLAWENSPAGIPLAEDFPAIIADIRNALNEEGDS